MSDVVSIDPSSYNVDYSLGTGMDRLLHWMNLSHRAFLRCHPRSEIVIVVQLAGLKPLLDIGELEMQVVAAQGWGPSPQNPFVGLSNSGARCLRIVDRWSVKSND